MALQVASLFAAIGADLSGLNKGLSQAQGKLQSAGSKIAGIGKKLTMGVTLPIVGIGTAAIKMGIDYESAFAGVRKTVDATEAEFAQLSDGFRRLATDTDGYVSALPNAHVQLARIGELAGQLGVSGVDNILKFTETIAMLGMATDLTVEQAATSLAQFANIVQMPIENIGRLGSVVVDLGNNFATTESTIVGFAQRLAGVGDLVGLTEAQIMAFGAAMGSVGINVEAGGSAMTRIFIEMAQAVAKGMGDTSEKTLQITNKYNEQVLASQKGFNATIERLQSDFADRRVYRTQDLYDQLADIERSYQASLAEHNQDYRDRQVDGEKDYADSVADHNQDYQDKITDLTVSFERRMWKAAKDGKEERVSELEEELQGRLYIQKREHEQWLSRHQRDREDKVATQKREHEQWLTRAEKAQRDRLAVAEREHEQWLVQQEKALKKRETLEEEQYAREITRLEEHLEEKLALEAEGANKLAVFVETAGMEMEQFRILFEEDPAAAMLVFIEGMGKIDEAGGNTFAVLEDLGLQNIRTQDTVLRLAGGGDVLADALNRATKAWEDNTALTEEAGKRAETTASEINVMMNNLREVGIVIAEELIPPLTDLLENYIVPFLQKLKELDPRIIEWGVKIAGVAVVLGPLLWFFGKLMTAVQAIITIAPAVGVAFTTMLGPIVLLLGAISALAFVWNKFQGEVSDFSGGAVEAAQELGLSYDELRIRMEKYYESLSAREKITWAFAGGFEGVMERIQAQYEASGAGWTSIGQKEIPGLFDIWPSITQAEIPGLFGMQFGGIVPGPIGAPVPILAHGGERVIPTGASGGGAQRGGDIVIIIDGREIARVMSPYLGQEYRRRGVRAL